MTTILVMTPDLTTGVNTISETIDVGVNPDDSTPITIRNPAVQPFEFATDGVSCRVDLEEPTTVFKASRRNEDAFNNPTGVGTTRLTLAGDLPIVYRNYRGNFDRAFYPIHYWLKNLNKVQITSNVFDLPEQGWTIERFNQNLERSPFILTWRILLTGGVREIVPTLSAG